MRILVVSDTHRDFYTLRQLVEQHREADVVVHLGDGEEEMEDVKALQENKMVVMVRGNCDWGSSLPAQVQLLLGGKRIFACHGHTYGVKHSLSALMEQAARCQADVVLFGHTHMPLEQYQDGVYYLNPGSLRYTGSYGIVDITPAGIVAYVARFQFKE